jgi:hypothetical protein
VLVAPAAKHEVVDGQEMELMDPAFEGFVCVDQEAPPLLVVSMMRPN